MVPWSARDQAQRLVDADGLVGGTEPGSWTPPTWEEVVRDHRAQVYRLAYRLTGDVFDAEDLTQDVFVRVFGSLHRYQPGTLEGWLHRITTNLFLDGVRRRRRIRFDGLADGSEDRLPSSWPTPSELHADAGLDHDVAAALAALSPDFRVAVVLCDIEGLSYERDQRRPRRQPRHRPQPHPPWTRPAARRAGPPLPDGGAGPLPRGGGGAGEPAPASVTRPPSWRPTTMGHIRTGWSRLPADMKG